MPSYTSIHLRSYGYGINGCRAAHKGLTDIYDLYLRTMKKKATIELFLSGRCPADKEAPITYSVTAHGTDVVELEWFKENIS